jgi:2-amino-4-hydroxy-6-hydroxymethyldihydropteridine diphosphokinase
MKRVYLALGSNLGDRAAMLQSAIAILESDELHVLRASTVYETVPKYDLNQGSFLNQVLEAETSLFPLQLLTRLKKLEVALGRRPSRPNGPRAIDIDILFYADAIVQMAELEVPHPKIAERRFVLEPLAELAPDLRHPKTGVSVKEMLAKVI